MSVQLVCFLRVCCSVSEKSRSLIVERMALVKENYPAPFPQPNFVLKSSSVHVSVYQLVT